MAWHFAERFDPLLKAAAARAGIDAASIPDYIPQPSTLLSKQHEDAIRLKKMLEEKGPDDPVFKEACQEHVETYAWILLANWIGDKLSLQDLLGQVAWIKADEKEKQPLAAPPEFKKYADIALRIGYLRQVGIESHSRYTAMAMPFLEAVARAAGVPYRDLLLLIPEEIYKDGTLAPDIKEKIARRQNDNWCIYPNLTTGVVEIIDDKEVVDRLAKQFLPKAESGSSALKGQIGNKGKATGPVRVIIATDDFHKMQKGDVLVTPMTTPDFVILMQKSAAIVTDMGGLLCHAAIVSRELGKPCIIGTNFATQVLKDGDMVEVDADTGVVRIL